LNQRSSTTLTPELAARFARAAMINVVREYPHKLDHVINGVPDLQSPQALHPVFYGSFDWHSCVHMHWLLARVLRLQPEVEGAARIRAICEAHYAPAKVAVELAYLRQENRASFERPYGWAWLMKLAAELSAATDPDLQRWSAQLAPLVEVFIARYRSWLPKAFYPIRHGVHSNSAFGILFALEFARAAGLSAFAAQLEGSARIWFAEDSDYPARWEPSGEDFLSPALVEAVLMQRVLNHGFREWFDRFLPKLAAGASATLFDPVDVSDPADPRIVHLAGLSLSRAWCWRRLAQGWEENDPLRARMLAAADAQIAAALPLVVGGDFMAEHWLASFAVLALTDA
jgi:hypothetical protein